MVQKIDRTLETLDTIIGSRYPIIANQWDRHYDKVENAMRYKRELKEALSILEGIPFTVVDKRTFERKVKEADFVDEIEEMNFLRIAIVTNFPASKSRAYLWLAPLRIL